MSDAPTCECLHVLVTRGVFSCRYISAAALDDAGGQQPGRASDARHTCGEAQEVCLAPACDLIASSYADRLAACPHPVHTLPTPCSHPVHILFTPCPHPVHTSSELISPLPPTPSHTLFTPRLNLSPRCRPPPPTTLTLRVRPVLFNVVLPSESASHLSLLPSGALCCSLDAVCASCYVSCSSALSVRELFFPRTPAVDALRGGGRLEGAGNKR